ncbi:hypothetical protein [Psychroflexus sp. ALD_RP9]|uniref:hypothetical protein n=1 Tax=Psychroflexus sp. ALD_RP9 TaxID=2777186 RepID=UPI001A8DCF1D|nr:hypothetical protein [Psychroflexus sp. ALD_RP9]QSS97200.1 hypothetical protein IMZ30_00330 [Psychroflexus sp. ALD_RP9]
MKTMPVIKFSLCFLISITALAQKTKHFKESFKVNDSPEVFLNINNAEITIETWNKDRVDVEAQVTANLENDEVNQKILDHFNFEALGNSKKVEIKSGILASDFFRKNAENAKRIKILTEDIKGPPTPPKPPLPPLPPSLNEIDFNFDMQQFNSEGKAYLKKFQDSIKAFFNNSDYKKQMKDWQEGFVKGWRESGKEDSIRILTYKIKQELKPTLRQARRKAIRLGKNHKVKTKILIKIPKNTQLNVNLKRSQLKVADINNINASLNYSSLQLSKLSGNNNLITARHSQVNIDKIESLNLSLLYSKKNQLGEVERLILNSKTSDVSIDEISNEAIIEGSFGNLVVNSISEHFKLIDISLKNSEANLNLPDVDYNFYVNSKSSQFNLKTELDFKVNKVFDTTVYQNTERFSTTKALNIKANYSTLNLN